MAPMINPFDAGGYTLAEMTTAINILPNVYTRLGAMGLFRFEGITQRSVIIEQAEGVLNLLPTVPAAEVLGADMLDGQYDQPLKVIAVDLAGARIEDVSAAIAQTVLEAAGRYPVPGVRAFVAEQLGIEME